MGAALSRPTVVQKPEPEEIGAEDGDILNCRTSIALSGQEDDIDDLFEFDTISEDYIARNVEEADTLTGGLAYPRAVC